MHEGAQRPQVPRLFLQDFDDENDDDDNDDDDDANDHDDNDHYHLDRAACAPCALLRS